jgi:hypothetical protein
MDAEDMATLVPGPRWQCDWQLLVRRCGIGSIRAVTARCLGRVPEELPAPLSRIQTMRMHAMEDLQRIW